MRHAGEKIGAFVVKQSAYGSNLTIYTIYYEISLEVGSSVKEQMIVRDL